MRKTVSYTHLLAKDNMNIADMSNKSKGSYAYTMIDVDSDIPESVKKDLELSLIHIYWYEILSGNKRSDCGLYRGYGYGSSI